MKGSDSTGDSSSIDSNSGIPDRSSESDNVVPPQQDEALDAYLEHISRCPVCRGLSAHPTHPDFDGKCAEGITLAILASQEVSEVTRQQLALWQQTQQQTESE
jgi:hypothetical protein